jgi:hypothetical protein
MQRGRRSWTPTEVQRVDQSNAEASGLEHPRGGLLAGTDGSVAVESGDYRVTSRLGPQAEYHPSDNSPKLVAAVVDVETTGTNPNRDKIVEFGICLFEYDRQTGRIYKVLGSWEWFEDPSVSIPPEITTITGITDEMVAGHASMIAPSTIC